MQFEVHVLKDPHALKHPEAEEEIGVPRLYLKEAQAAADASPPMPFKEWRERFDCGDGLQPMFMGFVNMDVAPPPGSLMMMKWAGEDVFFEVTHVVFQLPRLNGDPVCYGAIQLLQVDGNKFASRWTDVEMAKEMAQLGDPYMERAALAAKYSADEAVAPEEA